MDYVVVPYNGCRYLQYSLKTEQDIVQILATLDRNIAQQPNTYVKKKIYSLLDPLSNQWQGPFYFIICIW